ncbi:MAG TPA: ArsC/Spx/MgsR family protein [Lentimicrobium sp.]|nr:ArsC/Spx/MgsR family protein [Lentimicrobium sp.]
MDIYFYHYTKCKKSRAALEYLKENQIEPVIIPYIEEGINKDSLKQLFKLLSLNPSQMVRKQESYYVDELKDIEISEDDWLEILSNYPKLIKRPVITYGNKAALGDPPQNADQILTAYKKDHEDKN